MTESVISRFVSEESRIQVTYRGLPFGLFGDGGLWHTHQSCAAVDRIDGERVVRLCQFDRSVTDEQAIDGIRQLGCRPATHHELFALVQSKPELFSESVIVALGTYCLEPYDGPTRKVLRTEAGSIQSLSKGWDSWPPETLFLCVRLSEEVMLEITAERLVKKIVALAKVKSLPACALQRLLTDEGQETLDTMLVMAHADSLSEQPVRPAIPSASPVSELAPDHDEYLVQVDYGRVLNRTELESEFSGPGSILSSRKGQLIEHHETCRDIDEVTGSRMMVVKHFNRPIESKEAIQAMRIEGYRPAREDELFAFARAYPELQRTFRIIALGTCHRRLDDSPDYVSLLSVDQSGRRILANSWFGVTWDALSRFLFVRSDAPQPLSP